MFLYRLIYASRVAPGLDRKDIEEIARISARNNQQKFITGALAFDKNYFLQCLEGHRADINRLYQYVVPDPRHTDVLLLDFREINRREFGSWMMPYAGNTEANARIFFRYSSTDTFEPLTMSGECAFGLLRELESSQRN